MRKNFLKLMEKDNNINRLLLAMGKIKANI